MPRLNRKPPYPLGPWTERELDELRTDARYAYLNGQTKRARALNKVADKLAAKLRKLGREPVTSVLE